MTIGGTGPDGPDRLRCSLRELMGAGVFDLPQPGVGATAERLERLAGIAARDLQLARLAEAHLDAVTILREAGRAPRPDAIYGVWASEAPHAALSLDRAGDDADAESGTVVLHGRKAFCTGAGLVDRALVTATADDGVVLVDIATSGAGFRIDHDGWSTPAFAGTLTGTIEIEPRRVDGADLVGGPGWYLDRLGFWHGALAPAACWAGGAIGLAEHCLELTRGREPDEHVLAHLGVLDAASWELGVVLRAAGDTIDAFPDDPLLASRQAHRVRTVVERLVTLVVDHAARAHGPRLLAFDPWAWQRIAELQLYVRQHHDTRDHAALARLL